MRSEQLKIGDGTFLVNRLIQQAPVDTLVREFFKNAEENAALAPEGQRRVEIYPVDVDGVRKLAFWNTGIGMDEGDLRLATDISSSVNKTMSLDGNFGIGAKVSGLTMSPEGIRYRSCKAGIVHECVIGWDEDLKTYARLAAELPDGSDAVIYDVTEIVRDEGVRPLDKDWTEVVLLGETPEHDTVGEPKGMGVKVERSFVPTSIFRRFASFAPGVEVRVDVAMTKGGGANETGRSRSLRTLSDVLDRVERHETVEASDGLRIRFIHDPMVDGSARMSARANPATSSTTFCALVHRGERYDFRTGREWSSAAPSFGIPFGSKVLTVEIEVPDNLALPNQYRDALTWRADRAPMTASQFAGEVIGAMPDWVREVIRSQSPESSETIDDLQSDLQKLLDEYRMPTATLGEPSRRKAESKSDDAENGDASGREEDDDAPVVRLRTRTRQGRPAPDPQPSPRRSPRRMRQAPAGAKTTSSESALEKAPQVIILTEDEDIAEKSLKGRAGRYYREAQEVYVNGRYPVVDRMAGDLLAELTSEGDPEIVREASILAARKYLGFRLGKLVCYAISKRLLEDWTTDDLDKATTPESLSMAADDYRQSMSDARRWAREKVRIASLDATGRESAEAA